ncbi:MAG TPA: hypothetical protein VEY09_09290 [Pyrinomonadaceae bacterium]|nr:hypothetical protein [Pyrinomonadaceae bacterium]
MKAVLAKSLVVLAGAALVLPFVAVALLVGERASAGVEDGWGRLLLAVLAIGGALLGGAKSSRHGGESVAGADAARTTPWAEGESPALVGHGVR